MSDNPRSCRRMRDADCEVLAEAGHQAHRGLRQMLCGENLGIQADEATAAAAMPLAQREFTPVRA